MSEYFASPTDYIISEAIRAERARIVTGLQSASVTGWLDVSMFTVIRIVYDQPAQHMPPLVHP